MAGDPRSTLSGRRILVVEDERLIALDTQDILEGCGCVVLGPVGTAVAALELIERDLPDCAILDVQLADATSEPVAAMLRASGRPFVVTTAYPRAQLGDAYGDAPVLGKPTDETKLVQALSTQLEAG